MEYKPGDINEDGKEIEQDGDVTWEDNNNGQSEIRRQDQIERRNH